MTIDKGSVQTFLEARMPAAMEMLRQMVSINSFTANRDGVNRLGRTTAEYFLPLGFSAEFVPSMNPKWGEHLTMSRPGRSNKSLALVSHLDTVFPPEEELANHFHFQVEGDKIFGPGTLDIKGGTVMMWLVLQALRAHAPKVFEDISWKLFWNSSEERLSADFGGVCRSRLEKPTRAILIFEGENRAGNKRLMVAARKGRATWRVSVKGRSAHAGSSLANGANAIVQLGRTIQNIDALTDLSKNLTFNVAKIWGGTVLNRVPQEAFAEGEFRAFSQEVCREARSRLLALAGPGEIHSSVDGFRCQVEVKVTDESRPWPRNPATDQLLDLWQQAALELGTSVVAEERGGLSDGNSLWDVAPTLDGLGPWGDNDHCSERTIDGSKLPEFVEISSFVPKALLNTIAICRLAQP